MKRIISIVLIGLTGVLAGVLAVGPSTAHAVSGVVIAEETQVYAEPDLDAPVIAVLTRGARIPISKGTRGDYAKFRKTRANGKVGWISVLDVKSEDELAKLRKKAAKNRPVERPGRREAEPFLFTKAVGFAVGLTDYKESINGSERVANLLTYGLKLTGPDVFFEGPLMDVNILFHYGAPDYYERLSRTRPSGFITWIDSNLIYPIVARQDSMVGIGIGPLLVLSNIVATDSNQTYTMWALNVGLAAEITAGIRFSEIALRLDAKYWFERETYRQVQIAVQTVF